MLQQLADPYDEAEVRRLTLQRFYFCETPGCRNYGAWDDLIEQPAGERLCPADNAVLDDHEHTCRCCGRGVPCKGSGEGCFNGYCDDCEMMLEETGQ